MTLDYTILIFPGLLLLVFSLKYLVKRLYRLHFAKLEAERRENLNRILQSNQILQSFTNEHVVRSPRPWDRLRRTPPPSYELAIQQYHMPVFYIHIQDETPPPTYDDYLKMNTQGPPPRSPPCLNAQNTTNNEASL